MKLQSHINPLLKFSDPNSLDQLSVTSDDIAVLDIGIADAYTGDEGYKLQNKIISRFLNIIIINIQILDAFPASTHSIKPLWPSAVNASSNMLKTQTRKVYGADRIWAIRADGLCVYVCGDTSLNSDAGSTVHQDDHLMCMSTGMYGLTISATLLSLFLCSLAVAALSAKFVTKLARWARGKCNTHTHIHKIGKSTKPTAMPNFAWWNPPTVTDFWRPPWPVVPWNGAGYTVTEKPSPTPPPRTHSLTES
jgi:hypothetical protein